MCFKPTTSTLVGSTIKNNKQSSKSNNYYLLKKLDPL
jgi:hypothetical protein